MGVPESVTKKREPAPPSRQENNRYSDPTGFFQPRSQQSDAVRLIGAIEDWCHGWATHRDKLDARLFFEGLAGVLAELFRAQLVTIRDNNYFTQSLLLHACIPGRDKIAVPTVLSLRESLGGLAIEKRRIVVHERLDTEFESRRFQESGLRDALGLERMVSIPLSLPRYAPAVSFVVNLGYDLDHLERSQLSEPETERIALYLGHQIERLMYSRDEVIRSIASREAAKAKGLSSLFDAVVPSVLEYARANDVTLFTWEASDKQLVVEKSTLDDLRPGDRFQSSPRERDRWGPADPWSLIAEEARHGKPIMRFAALLSNDMNTTPAAARSLCNVMAVPIRSSANELLALVACSAPMQNAEEPPSFNSVDLHALETFADAFASHTEISLRHRQEHAILRVIRDVSVATLQASRLEASLESSLRILAPAMHSGSVPSVVEKRGLHLRLL